MRSANAILSSFVLSAILLFASAAVLYADELSDAARIQLEVHREWSSISNGRTDFEISDPALVPRLLALAALQSGCRYKEEIKTAPVRFTLLEGRRLAIVYCYGVIGSHQVFDLSDLRKPTLVDLPFLAPPNGFGTTPRPGWITCDKAAGIFQAETGSDMLPSPRIRHSYRFEANRGFVVVRVEIQPGESGKWTTIWDAPEWTFPAKPK